MVKALVTGATGFIGSHLCALLCERGYEVAAAGLTGAHRDWLAGLPARYIEVDLRVRRGLREAVRGAEMIFHLAGLTRGQSRREYHIGNCLTTRNLLEVVREAGAAGRRFLYVSSAAAAGPASPGRPAVETDPPHPITFYGTSKLAAEGHVRRYASAFPVTIVRPPAVYGPRDENLAGVFRAAAHGVFFLPNGGRAQVSLAYVSDLVGGLALAAESPGAVGQTYYLSGDVTDFRHVGRLLEGILGRRLRRLYIPPPVLRLGGEVGELKWRLTRQPQIMCRRKVKDILQPSWAVSDAKARADPTAQATGLGYCPRVGLEEGLRRTLSWYREHGWV